MKAHIKSHIKVLFEDERLLAVSKPAGLLTVPAPNVPESKTLQGRVRDWAKAQGLSQTPYLLHRLDRETSGVILFGKNPQDREKLENIFRDHKTEKTYLALVKGLPRPPKGTIKIPLAARTARLKVPATTHYKVKKALRGVSLVEVRIETGRKHQIRQHMSMIRHPLVLDKLYGDRRFDAKYRQAFPNARMLLHAEKLSFHHPFTGQKISIIDSK